MQGGKSQPSIAGNTTEVRAADQVGRNESMITQPELSIFSATRLDRGCIAAVNLRSVPPVTIVADVCGWAAGAGGIAGIRFSALNFHRILVPLVAFGQWHAPGVLGQVIAMAEPVMNLELEP